MIEMIFWSRYNDLVTDYYREEDNLSAWELDMVERYYNLFTLEYLEGVGKIDQKKRAELQGQAEPIHLPKHEMEKIKEMEFHLRGHKVDVLEFKHIGGLIRYCEKYPKVSEFERYITKLPYSFLHGGGSELERELGMDTIDEHPEFTYGLAKVLVSYGLIKIQGGN